MGEGSRRADLRRRGENQRRRQRKERRKGTEARANAVQTYFDIKCGSQFPCVFIEDKPQKILHCLFLPLRRGFNCISFHESWLLDNPKILDVYTVYLTNLQVSTDLRKEEKKKQL